MSAIIVPKNIKPANLANTLKFVNTLKARDKVLRFVQYFSRYLAYQFEESELGARLTLLHKGIGLHRKAFKIGAFVDEYEKFMKTLNEAKEDLKKTLTLALRAIMGVFVFLDNLVWFTSLKVIKLEKDPLKKKAYYFRLTAALLNTALNYMDIVKTQEKIDGAEDDSEDKKAARVKQGANIVTLVKNVADICTYGNSAKVIEMVAGKGLDDGTIGLLGSVSAVAGGFSIWAKMK